MKSKYFKPSKIHASSLWKTVESDQFPCYCDLSNQKVSGPLFVSGFNIKLKDANIKDISVIISKSGKGEIVDDKIQLVFAKQESKDLQIIELQTNNEVWFSDIHHCTYSLNGPIDLDILKNENFGVIFSAKTLDDQAFGSANIENIKISVQYEPILKINEVNLKSIGHASEFDSLDDSEDIELKALATFDETGSGGVAAGGTTPIVYDMTQKNNEYNVNLINQNTNEFFPCYIQVIGNQLFFDFQNVPTSITTIRFRYNDSESTIFRVENVVELAPQTKGFTTVSSAVVTDIAQDLLHITARNTSGTIVFHTFINRNNAKISGQALIETLSDIVVSGGIVVGGETTPERIFIPEIDPYGATLEGTAPTTLTQIPASGIIASGSAEEEKISNVDIETGTFRASGTAEINAILSGEAEGGITANGQAQVGTTESPSGGVSLEGSADLLVIRNPPITGGVSCHPSHDMQFTYSEFNDLSPKTGVVISGTARNDVIRKFSKQETVMYYAINSTIVLDKIKDKLGKNTRFDGYEKKAKEKFSPYRIEKQGGYSEFGESGINPYIGKYVKSNQKGYMPKKDAYNTPQAGQITRLY